MPFLPWFTCIRHLAHVLSVPPNKSVTTLRYNRRHGPVYIQAMPVGTYRVQSLGFLRSSIKNRIIVLRTVQSMFSELTVRPIKNGLYKGSVACFDF